MFVNDRNPSNKRRPALPPMVLPRLHTIALALVKCSSGIVWERYPRRIGKPAYVKKAKMVKVAVIRRKVFEKRKRTKKTMSPTEVSEIVNLPPNFEVMYPKNGCPITGAKNAIPRMAAISCLELKRSSRYVGT